MHPTKFQKPIMLVLWHPMNPQGNEWNHLYLKVTETTLHNESTTIWYTSSSLCRKPWKSWAKEPSLPESHGNYIAEWKHYNLVHKFIPLPQAMKIPGKGLSGQRLEEARNSSSMAAGDGQEQKRSYSGGSKRQRESPLCYIDGLMSSLKSGVRTKISEARRSGRAPWWHCDGQAAEAVSTT